MSPEEPTTLLDPKILRATAALLATQTAIGRLIETEAVAPTGLDPTTADLMVRLDQAPGSRLRAVDLSRQLLLSPSHISRTIDRAEAAGLVSRAPDPDDRRAAQVEMTPAGRAALADFAPRLTGLLRRVVHQTLSADEIDLLVGLLDRLEAAARQPETPVT